ncbi:MAG: hypothetical protein ACRD2O_06815 [Terriglobia bacterium]
MWKPVHLPGKARRWNYAARIADNTLDESAVTSFQSQGALRIIRPEAYQALLARYGKT